MKKLTLFAIAVILLAVCMTACGSREEPQVQPEPEPEEASTAPGDTLAAQESEEEKRGVIHRWASLEDFEIRMLETVPVQVDVLVKGHLTDSCTKLDRIRKQHSGSKFWISVSSLRPVGMDCPPGIVPFEKTIALDVQGLKPGTYTVTVNDLSKTFSLKASALPKLDPDAKIYRPAHVDSITILPAQSGPSQIQVLVRGYLSDGCTKIHQIEQGQNQKTNTLWAKITTERPKNMNCPQVIVPFEEIISLGVQGLKPDTYLIDINGVNEMLVLDEEGVPQR